MLPIVQDLQVKVHDFVRGNIISWTGTARAVSEECASQFLQHVQFLVDIGSFEYFESLFFKTTIGLDRRRLFSVIHLTKSLSLRA